MAILLQESDGLCLAVSIDVLSVAAAIQLQLLGLQAAKRARGAALLQ